MMPWMCHNVVMEMRPYVDNLCRELMVAAEAGGEDARVLVERLIGPLESAIRLTLLSVLSTAAEEITRDLAPQSVEVRLRGLDPSFVVMPPLAGESFEDTAEGGFGDAPDGVVPCAAGPWPPGPPNGDEGGAAARVNFRLSGQLKAQVEEAAGREGLSVNAWLVRAVTATLRPDGRRPERRAPRSEQRYTGWVR